jgi:pimeloyl-ACP methyl ester carboxylesterase
MKRLIYMYFLFLFVACQEKKKNEGPVKNGDVTIAYTLSGTNDTAIVFVHGWGINQTYWDNQKTEFSKKFTVVTLDLGGHGKSSKDRSSWSVNDFGNDVLAVLNALELEKLILVGHSMGGNIILDVAHKIPEKVIGFVGVDNFKDETKAYTPEQRAQIDSFMHSLRTNFDAVAASYSYGALFPPGYSDSVSMKRVISDIQQTDSVVAIDAIESLMKESLREGELISGLRMPVHLIVSDYTPVNEEALKRNCKHGYSVKTVKGTGHYPMIEKPLEFNAHFAAVLRKIQFRKL